jgi:hypothetical protein
MTNQPTRQNIIAYCLRMKRQAKTDEDKAYWTSLLEAQQDIDWENQPNYQYQSPKSEKYI